MILRVGSGGIEPPISALSEQCRNRLAPTPHVLAFVDLGVAVCTHQNTLVQFFFDLHPGATICRPDSEVLLAWVKMMKVQGSHRLIVPTDLASVAFVVVNQFPDSFPSTFQLAGVTPILGATLASLILEFATTI